MIQGRWICVALLLAVGCGGGEGPAEPRRGPQLLVSTSTSGIELDVDGYLLTVSGRATPLPIALNDTVAVTGLTPGEATLGLVGVAGNCSTGIENPRVVSAPTAGIVQVAFDVTCAAPSEDVLAFNSHRAGTANHEIFSMTAAGRNFVQLTQDPSQDTRPSWSPDGTRIAFETDREGNFEIYVMNSDGTNAANVTRDLGADSDPRWSPDGSRIAFSSARDGDANIYVVNVDGTGLLQLTDDPQLDLYPAWSPDGSRLTFASEQNQGWDIHSIRADGSDRRNLTQSPDDEFRSSWSPDGSRIAFEGETTVFVMNADGSGRFDLTRPSRGREGNPAWSADGSRIAFISSRHGMGSHPTDFDVYVVEVATGRLQRLTEDRWPDQAPAWKP